jgi:hypothetical protein
MSVNPEARGHVIEMTGSAQPQYLSEQIGRNFGSPYGGWTADINEATVYGSEDEARALFDKALVGVAPFCKVVAR